MGIKKHIEEQADEEDSIITKHPPELTIRSGLALLGAFLAYFQTIGFLNTFGVFQDYYTLDFLSNKSNFDISWIGSFSLFMFFFPSPFVGMIADRTGPTLPMAIGVVLELVAVFMTSLCTKYYQFFLAQGFLLGLGTCFIATPATGICPRYFVRNRGLAMGVTAAGSSIGGVVWPIVADQLLKTDKVGFAWTMRAIGFIMIPISAIMLVVAQPPRQPRKQASDSIDLAFDGQSDWPQSTEGSENAGGKSSGTTSGLAKFSALRSPVFILLCVGMTTMNFGFTPPVFYVTTYASQLGINGLSFYFSSILNGASLFGRILPGWIADKYGKFNVFILSGLSAGIVVFCWTAADNLAGLIVWSMAFGFCSGAILSLGFATASTVVPKDIVTTAIGTAMGCNSIANLLASPIAGGLLSSGGYTAVSCYSGAMLIGGAVLILFGRLRKSRDWRMRI